jgi:hypothetical protein
MSAPRQVASHAGQCSQRLIARPASLIRPAGRCAAHVDFHNPSDLTFEGFERSLLQHRPRRIRCRRRVRSGNARTAVGPPRPEMTYRRMRNRSVQSPEDGTCSSYPSICYAAEYVPARADINNELISILVRAMPFFRHLGSALPQKQEPKPRFSAGAPRCWRRLDNGSRLQPPSGQFHDPGQNPDRPVGVRRTVVDSSPLSH